MLPGVGEVYRMVCPLPVRSGRHVIYHVWQRDDSPEAFYACVDVLLVPATSCSLMASIRAISPLGRDWPQQHRPPHEKG